MNFHFPFSDSLGCTELERKRIHYIASGHQIDMAAHKEGVSDSAIKLSLKSARQKGGFRNTTALIANSVANGIVEIFDANRINEIPSRKNLQVLQELAYGLSLSQIAYTLGISESSVKYHLKECSKKLLAVNSTHSIAKAMSLGLIHPITLNHS